MKTNQLSIILTCFLIALFINSCTLKKEPPKDAFDIIKEERMLRDDTNFISKETIQESMQSEPITIVKNIKKPDEWTTFENEIELKIKLNEEIIAEIKENPHSNFFFKRKLKFLENGNNNLRIALAKFNEDVEVKWAKFKTTINHDANSIEIELNAMKDEKKK